MPLLQLMVRESVEEHVEESTPSLPRCSKSLLWSVPGETAPIPMNRSVGRERESSLASLPRGTSGAATPVPVRRSVGREPESSSDSPAVSLATAPCLDGVKGDKMAPVGEGTSPLVEAGRMVEATASLLQPNTAAADAGLALQLPVW